MNEFSTASVEESHLSHRVVAATTRRDIHGLVCAAEQHSDALLGEPCRGGRVPLRPKGVEVTAIDSVRVLGNFCSRSKVCIVRWAIDGSLTGVSGRGAVGSGAARLRQEEPWHATYGTTLAELEVQRPIRRAELWAFTVALSGLDNVGIWDGQERRKLYWAKAAIR